MVKENTDVKLKPKTFASKISLIAYFSRKKKQTNQKFKELNIMAARQKIKYAKPKLF